MIAAEPLPGSPTWRRQPVPLRHWQARTGRRSGDGQRGKAIDGRGCMNKSSPFLPPRKRICGGPVSALGNARWTYPHLGAASSVRRRFTPARAGPARSGGRDSHGESERDDRERSLPSCAPGWRIRRVTASYLGDDAAGHVSLARLAVRSGGMMESARLIAYSATRREDDHPRGRGFPEPLVAAVPYEIHTALTGNDIQFPDLTKNREGLDRQMAWPSLRSRLSTPRHRASPDQAQSPHGTDGLVERMNRPPTEAIVRRYHDDTHR